jgi:DNA-binding NarL/FixJ family response regulator
MKKRILLVEDHRLLRQGFRSLVSTLPDFEVVGEARDGKEAIRQCLSLSPDLIMMDLSMPGMTGIEATTQIKRRMPKVRVLALTAYKTDEYVREALRAGADGYVLKDASYEELVLALRQVVTGKRFVSANVSGHLDDAMLRDTQPSTSSVAPTAWNSLTTRERSILKLIAEGNTNRAAAEYLNVSPKTIEKHRASVMRKLGLRTVTELVVVALEVGLIERPGTVSRLLERESSKTGALKSAAEPADGS